jgi:flavin-binding protein dodecin
MFKMTDVVGISPVGFSEAVKAGIDKLIAAGEKVHFFQVLEQRGAVQDGEFREFQVVLRVATEFLK